MKEERRRRRRGEGGWRRSRRRRLAHCYGEGELLRPALLHVNFPGEHFGKVLSI